QFLLTERRRRFDALYFDGKLVADENFPAGDEPLHVGGLDIVRVEQVAARPDDGSCSVAKATKFFTFELRRMLQFACAMIDIPLPRPALKENGDSQKFLPVFNSAQQARGGAFPYIPLTV